MHRDRLKRRQFITLLGGAAVAGPRALIAQPAPRKYRVGALVPFPLAALTVFVDTLRQLGFVDGQNVTIDGRGFAVSYERLPAIAAERRIEGGRHYLRG